MIIASVAAAAVSAGVGAMLAPKPTKMPTALSTPMPTRTGAMGAALNADRDFRKRQGAAATVVTGPNGAEAPSPGVKSLLGQ
jgi:hypothetical protein